ncbi:MAG TPA: serine hydrolase domain-containing protein [Propionibacteriaceae bacterium]
MSKTTFSVRWEMRHSYTVREEVQKSGLATGYRYWFGYPVAASDLPPGGSLSAGLLISSTEDTAHYLITQLNGGRYGDAQVLSLADIAEMHRPAVQFTTLGAEAQYGMGWYVNSLGQTTMVWHDGIVPDFFSYMAILPEQHKGIILLLQGASTKRSGQSCTCRSADSPTGIPDVSEMSSSVHIDDEAIRTSGLRAISDIPSVGGGVVTTCRAQPAHDPYNGGEAPIDKEQFVNARAEDYWTLRSGSNRVRSTSSLMTTTWPLSRSPALGGRSSANR